MVNKYFLVFVFVLFSNKILCDEVNLPQYGQNLGQYIKTEIIDLPDDTSGSSGQVPFINGLNWYPSYLNNGNKQVDPPRTKLPLPFQGVKSAKTSEDGQSHQRPKEYSYPLNISGLNISAQNSSYIPLGQYYGAPYQQPLTPYYPTPLVYRPFYPSQYIRSYFPSLYNQFPNGFYVFPDSENISALTKRLPSTKVTTEKNRINIQQPFKSNIGNNKVGQPNGFRLFNSTNLGETKSFVSHIELKPVSTKFTRYNRPDGKMYVRIISTDSNGEQKVTENEYNGNIDLKINNGMLETPGSKNKTVVKDEESINSINVDPNSITIERREEQLTETGEPVDVNSWIY